MLKHTSLLAAVGCAILFGVADVHAQAKQPKKKPQVEVVFCLDTTGSMSGLINAAKQKIWAISNQIAGGDPTPELKVGLIAYRDRKDSYVTKVYDLTDDLDSVYNNLMGFRAGGGGDTPESVNQALHEAVSKIKWSKGDKALRIIFLVGDAPPHMDYRDDVKYPETCQLAARNGIIINTIQCGNIRGTEPVWRKISQLAEGSYVRVDQNRKIVVVSTPYDKELTAINSKLAKTTLTFGTAQAQASGEKLKKLSRELKGAKAASRAGFYANSRRGASYDLLYNLQTGKVKLKDLKKEQLPPELRKLTLEQQKTYLKKLESTRANLNKRARDLDQQRKVFIAKKEKEQLKNRAPDSFDNQVLTILQRQAGRIQVRYAAPDAKTPSPKK